MLTKLDKMIDVNLPSIAMLIESGDRFKEKKLPQKLNDFKEFDESDDEETVYSTVGGATGLLIGVAQKKLINSPAIKILQSNSTNSEFLENLEAFDEEFGQFSASQELKEEEQKLEERLNISQNMEEGFNDMSIRNEFMKYSTKYLITDELNFYMKYQIYMENPSDELETEIINQYITGKSPIKVSYKLKTKMEVLLKKGQNQVALELVNKEVPSFILTKKGTKNITRSLQYI
jgi:hypothetical protein